jgi:hypothetical protein
MTEFPDAEEHARAILEAARRDYKLALVFARSLRSFGFSEEYCHRIEALLTPKSES